MAFWRLKVNRNLQHELPISFFAIGRMSLLQNASFTIMFFDVVMLQGEIRNKKMIQP